MKNIYERNLPDITVGGFAHVGGEEEVITKEDEGGTELSHTALLIVHC
jgi:hypothetical protein